MKAQQNTRWEAVCFCLLWVTVILVTLGAGCGPGGSAVPGSCRAAGQVNWRCVREAHQRAPEGLEHKLSPASVREAVAYYVACMETGDVRTGREGMEWVLREKLQPRGRFPRAAQMGGLLVLASYLHDMRMPEAVELSTLLAGMYGDCVTGGVADADLQQLLRACTRQIPIFAARKLYRSGLPPCRPSTDLTEPILPPRTDTAGGGRLMVARLRLYGEGVRPADWGEIDLFHLSLAYALAAVDQSIVLVPHEAERVLSSKLGGGESIDDCQVAALLKEYAWALGCQSVLVVGGLSDGSTIRLLNAYIYSPQTAMEFDGYFPRVARDASGEFDLADGDLLTGVPELARWVSGLLNPGHADRATAVIEIPTAPRVELRELARMLAAGDGEGALRSCVDLRGRAASGRGLVRYSSYYDYTEELAVSQVRFGSVLQFRRRILDAMLGE